MDRGLPPAGRELVAPADVREQLRLAFARWGLPGRSRVDHGGPWGARGDSPTARARWLIGLGVARHGNHPRRPQEDGVVARSQGTSVRWCEPWTCAAPGGLQARWERMDRVYRAVAPDRNRRSRRAAFPGLVHSGRPSDRATEATPWDWSRVAADLARIVVPRGVDQSGRVSLSNQGHDVGRLHQGTDVYVMSDPERNE